jgi:hypothetical protein
MLLEIIVNHYFVITQILYLNNNIPFMVYIRTNKCFKEYIFFSLLNIIIYTFYNYSKINLI